MPPEGVSLKEVTAAYERQWIESALEAAGGVQKRAAELLHIKPTTLNEMIKRYDIRPRRKKASTATTPEGAAASPKRQATNWSPWAPTSSSAYRFTAASRRSYFCMIASQR